ncbi:YdcF family protein [Streptomyces sp. CSDS2]|uniref:YdcF family protein n=1 Tax=Streptomyces sp. CSDS2 TaxID=3055051 RepID=UPI0025AF5260|nr:YdcF family protein [Streptomyces sp. CSDS2]MDN3264373.1 YdcF family protein [Streptomyces sp. CSDS2]
MSAAELGAEQIRDIVGFVDIEAPPPQDEPTAHFLFGTNQTQPVEIAARQYHKGLAPLIIASGGINRHTGIVEARVFRELLIERGVPGGVIRCEDQAANTWQNVEFSRPYLREALESGLKVTAVSKWFHRRTLHCLATVVPDIGPFYAISWEPIYAGQVVSRTDWIDIPDGKRRVLREWEEVPRRVSEGSFRDVALVGGAWQG